jgi:hypothetical protein
MKWSNLGAAGISLLLFGFLALMAWTGKLAGVDGFKVRLWSWIVEDIGVTNLGRSGATVLFAGLGLASVLVILWVRRQWF